MGHMVPHGESRLVAADDPSTGTHDVVARPAWWCQNGTMRRMNLRDVPDDVYAVLAEAAAAQHQSLSAYVVQRLGEMARVARIGDYLDSYAPPRDSGVTLEDATAAVRETREAS